ncbi:MAG: divergent polysaccharide deacetylase family protein [Thiovulaceae bacterium]|nr:divergent polysaccharide deacetylase family protein [Sulfurimonadaceae bacterium]
MATSRKPTPKKSVNKPSSKKQFDLHTFLHYFYWVLAIVSVLGAASVVSFYTGYNMAKEEDSCVLRKHVKVTENLQRKITELSELTAKHEYEDASTPPKGAEKRVQKVAGKRGQLVIIFDDVSFAGDVRHIKALDIPVTMSFLPPTARHPDSAKLAADEPYYMVHLPMEAMNFNSPEKSTLLTTDTKQSVIERIEEIEKLFPNVEYINNHTGSKFTSDENAMNKLIFALRLEKIGFIDSRTTAQSKAKKVMDRYKMPYIARDIFLDNEADVKSIKSQIKKAIRIASKYGQCIAICHPHKATLQALEASKSLFKDIELVRIDKLRK